MWKYKCRTMFFSLIGAFAAGFLLAMFMGQNPVFQQMLKDMLPAAVYLQFTGTPWLLWISGGIGFAGLLNVFLIGNLLSSYLSGGTLLFLAVVMLIPEYAILFGVYALPVMLAVSLYGWISLNRGVRLSLKKADISGDGEIVRMYKLHHPLDEKYRALGQDVKKTVQRINIASGLGIAAMVCSLFLVNSLMLDMIVFVILIVAMQYLSRIRAQAFNSIAGLLMNECNPEACASALIYYSEKRNGSYKLANRALLAQCLIYMNEPALAQDVLISYPKSSPNNLMAYWSLMGYTYYLLKDENGLNRAKEEMIRIKPAMGPMGAMIKSEETAALENKIRLMNGDFNTCKKYFLGLLQRSGTNLQRADCDYYIALISFVQEDYELAKMYFEKTVQIGNKLYFVRNARNYLKKIEETDDPSQTTYSLSIGDDSES